MKYTKKYRLSFTEKAKQIINKMSLEEKIHLMGGWMRMEDLENMAPSPDNKLHYNHIPYGAGGNEEFQVPPMLFCDGPRGVVCGTGRSTCFPVSMLRGASFDPELEERIGHAIGKEVRAFGGNLFAGVCINLPYNPGWGRSQETYGEESFAIGQMAAKLVQGVQSEQVMACVKHFAFNSMEISRFKCSVDCDRRTEREVYLPHFKDCVDVGAASIMSSYNQYKGTYCGQSDYLLRKVLKEEWDFDGFVMSDFVWGIRDTIQAGNGGQDMEMCWTKVFGDNLVKAVRDGVVPEERVNESVLRIVRTILAFENGYQKTFGEEVIGCKDHIALALESALKGISLLQNKEHTLPFSKKNKKIAIIGKLADRENIGDHGSSRVFPAYVVTPKKGIETLLPEAEIVYCDGSNLEEAKVAARNADSVIFVVGFNHDDEGEYISDSPETNYTGSMGGDRKESLGLHQDEIALIKAIGPENKNSAVVLIGGNMIMISEWKDAVSAILMAYYPGQEGGTAIAQILFGDVNPSGKLPFVLPYKETDLPSVNWDTTNQFYGYFHGYTKLEKEGIEPLLPYGFGLSYTDFEIRSAEFSTSDDSIIGKCQITNVGDKEGTELIQLYVGFKNSMVNRPIKILRGFTRVELLPGESRIVSIVCPIEKVKWYNPSSAAWELEHMDYEIYIGTSSSEKDLLQGKISL